MPMPRLVKTDSKKYHWIMQNIILIDYSITESESQLRNSELYYMRTLCWGWSVAWIIINWTNQSKFTYIIMKMDLYLNSEVVFKTWYSSTLGLISSEESGVTCTFWQWTRFRLVSIICNLLAWNKLMTVKWGVHSSQINDCKARISFFSS